MNDQNADEEAAALNFDRAVDLLQQLGLKEYEAKCFAVLSGRSQATAKEISEGSDVPRTRVYDAVRVLEAKGLVEVQHASPQQFRAIPAEEAVATLRQQYGTRFDDLRTTLEGLDTNAEEEEDATHEVWTLTGSEAIASRTLRLLEEAEEEVVFVAGDEAVLSPELLDHLNEHHRRGVSVILGAVSPSLGDRLEAEVPEARTFVSELRWLRGSEEEEGDADGTAIGRLLLVDRNTILVSTRQDGTERAVFGQGFGNGFVVVVRRLMATGLAAADDPGSE